MQIENDKRDTDEPVEGWQKAPLLIDTELVSTVLCRFTGRPLTLEHGCLERSIRQHPDVECQALYFQAEALYRGVVGQSEFPTTQEEVRVPWSGGDVIGTTHS